MKIFQFSFGDGYAGSSKVAILSSKLLSEKGHNVALFASEGSLTAKRAVENGVKVVSLNSSVKFKALIKPVSEIFREEKPGFVISHHSLDRKTGFKLKSLFRNQFINIGYRHNISKSFPVIGAFMYNRYYDALIACSGGVAGSLIASGIKKSKVKIIYNGISVPGNLDTVTGKEIRQSYNIHNRIVLGLSTWFHRERKGFDILFRAFSKLNEIYVLLLVGIPDSGKREVLDYASEFGIEPNRIILPGYVENIWDYYKAMDLFLLPSRSEGFSLAMLEAAAAKLPIIASNITGTNEFIRDGENGLLFNVENPDQLKEKIELLHNNKKMADEMSSRAHDDVMDRFLIEQYADNLEKYLMQLSARSFKGL